MFEKDTVYQHTTDVVDFDFDKKIARVFPDMAHRSIPGYASLLSVLQAVFRTEFSDHVDLLIYDLGCSVGGATVALANVLPTQTRFIGIDISPDMLAQYDKAIRVANISERTHFFQQSILDHQFEPCQGIAINFTLQFLPSELRQSALNHCHNALTKDGILFIAEKTLSNADTTAWHEQFKRNNGYSELEIAQKRKAIENVMKIDNESTIIKRCKQAGFTTPNPVFNALGFKAWVMRK